MKVFCRILGHAVYQLALISCIVVFSCMLAWSPGWASTRTYTNSMGMEFVFIPAGTFIMGAVNRTEVYQPHQVTISQGFYLGRYEVTQEQWEKVMGTNPSHFKGAENPVENISWDEAQAFILLLNQMEGHERYRLPTEAEWEHAARAGTTGFWFFTDAYDIKHTELWPYAWFDPNAGSTTHPVGQKEPNPWGLYDIYGNVREWVQDRWAWPYAPAIPSIDPQGPTASQAKGAYRKNRGGCYGDGYYTCSSTLASSELQNKRNRYIGLRLALTAYDNDSLAESSQHRLEAKSDGSDVVIQPVARVAYFPAGEGLEECLNALGPSNISFAPRGNEALGGSLIDDAILVLPEKDYTVDLIKAQLKDDGSIVPIREIEAHIAGSGEAGRGLVFWWRMPETIPPFVVVLNSGKNNEKIWWPSESGEDGSFLFSDEFAQHEQYGKTCR